MEQLAQLLEQALRERPAAAPAFKPPKFDGTGDVELFLEQFEAVQVANAWADGAALLHLRSSLEGSAREYGRGATLPLVQASLRGRYGLTTQQARDRLASLHWERGQDLHALGVECKRLTNLSYPDVPDNHREVLAVQAIKRCLGNKALAQHLLAVQVDTVEGVVNAAKAFLQAGTNASANRGHAAAMAIQEAPKTGAVEADGLQKQLAQLMGAVQANAEAIKTLSKRPAASPNKRYPPKGGKQPVGGEKPHPQGTCFGCGSKDHWKRECPKLREQQGNAKGPQQ